MANWLLSYFVRERRALWQALNLSEYIYCSSKWLYAYRNPINRRCFHAIHLPSLRFEKPFTWLWRLASYFSQIVEKTRNGSEQTKARDSFLLAVHFYYEKFCVSCAPRLLKHKNKMTYARPQKRGNTINECIQLEEGPKFGGIKLLAPRPYKPKRGVITAHYWRHNSAPVKIVQGLK